MSAMIAEIRIDDDPPIQGELTIEVEQIDVTLGTKTSPDLSWEYVDAKGHFHAFDEKGELPTLGSRREHVACCGHDEEYDCDGYDITVYFCAICEETVEPAYVVTHSTAREFAPGRTYWQVEVAGDVPRGKRVSVRVVTRHATYFGVGVSEGVLRAEGGSNGVRQWSVIGCAGPLGRRKAVAVPA